MQVQRSCSSLQLNQPSAESWQLVLSPGWWHGGTELVSVCPSLVTHSSLSCYTTAALGRQPGYTLLPGKHCDTTATKCLGLGMGEHPTALQRKDRILFSLKFWRCDWIFFGAAGNNSSPCNFCIHLVLEQMPFQQILFQNWHYLWA